MGRSSARACALCPGERSRGETRERKERARAEKGEEGGCKEKQERDGGLSTDLCLVVNRFLLDPYQPLLVYLRHITGAQQGGDTVRQWAIRSLGHAQQLSQAPCKLDKAHLYIVDGLDLLLQGEDRVAGLACRANTSANTQCRGSRDG